MTGVDEEYVRSITEEENEQTLLEELNILYGMETLVVSNFWWVLCCIR